MQRDCRFDRALLFARTVALHADTSFLIDAFTPRLSTLQKRPKPQVVFDLMTDVRVLHLLRPLIDAGAISFRAPFSRFCETHYKELQDRAARLSRSLRSSVGTAVNCEKVGDYLLIRGHDLSDPPLTAAYRLSVREVRSLAAGGKVDIIARRYIERRLLGEVRDLLLHLQACQTLGAALISSSRFEMLALNDFDGGRARFESPERWEAPRSLQLPWINSLTVPEVVRLRGEAGVALAGLRERLSVALLYGEGASLGNILAELREEASAVEAELQALQRKWTRQFRSIAGVLGLGFSVYGFAAGLVPPAQSVAMLTSLLALMHSVSHRDEQESIRLTARPGYALLRARNILKHREKR
jgi:hypothetical protein